jgi:hypothetical protein
MWLPRIVMLVGSVLAGGAAPEPPIVAMRDAIIAEANGLRPEGLNFDRATSAVRHGGGTSSASNRVDRWNGHGWSLVSVAGKPPTREQREQHRRVAAAMPVPGYYQLAAMLAAATSTSSDSQGRVSWLIPVLPAGSIFTESGDISAHLKAEARLVRRGERVWIDQLRVTEREPFKMNFLIKVTGFVQTSDYQLGPDGKPRLAGQMSQSDGTMFGFPGGEKAQVTFVYR